VPGFGNKLMLKRLAKGLSMKEAARESGLKQRDIRALEEEEILRFKDKDQIAESLTRYGKALGMNRIELLTELDALWSDSSTAKAYLQQKYNRPGWRLFLQDNPLVAYGAVVAVAVMALTVGGYLYWSGIDQPGGAAGLTAAPLAGDETVTNPEREHSFSEPLHSEQNQDELLVAGIENNSAVEDILNGDSTGQAEEKSGAAEPDRVFEENTVLNGEDQDQPAQPVELEAELAENTAENYQEMSLPRSGGNAFLLWTGTLTFITGLVLLLLPLHIKEQKERFVCR